MRTIFFHIFLSLWFIKAWHLLICALPRFWLQRYREFFFFVNSQPWIYCLHLLLFTTFQTHSMNYCSFLFLIHFQIPLYSHICPRILARKTFPICYFLVFFYPESSASSLILFLEFKKSFLALFVLGSWRYLTQMNRFVPHLYVFFYSFVSKESRQ